jgi:hypothetical protein
MLTETIKNTDGTETTVQYHSEGFGRGARPAINVKWHGVYDVAQSAAVKALADELGEQWVTADGAPDSALDLAVQMASEEWWETAADAALRLGLGAIETEGRSGGWLVFTDGRDPQEMQPYNAGLVDDPNDLDLLHCDYCSVIETAADLPSDWNGETGNHEACEERVAWLAAYRTMVQWCEATIDGGDVPALPARVNILGGETDDTPTEAYHSDGVAADVLWRLSDMAEQERDRRATTEVVRSFTESQLREALAGGTSGQQARVLAAYVFGGQPRMQAAYADPDSYKPLTEADAATTSEAD